MSYNVVNQLQQVLLVKLITGRHQMSMTPEGYLLSIAQLVNADVLLNHEQIVPSAVGDAHSSIASDEFAAHWRLHW